MFENTKKGDIVFLSRPGRHGNAGEPKGVIATSVGPKFVTAAGIKFDRTGYEVNGVGYTSRLYDSVREWEESDGKRQAWQRVQQMFRDRQETPKTSYENVKNVEHAIEKMLLDLEAM